MIQVQGSPCFHLIPARPPNSDSVTVLDARPMPYEGVSAGNSDLDNYPPIPTSKQPSDHLPLGVDVSF